MTIARWRNRTRKHECSKFFHKSETQTMNTISQTRNVSVKLCLTNKIVSNNQLIHINASRTTHISTSRTTYFRESQTKLCLTTNTQKKNVKLCFTNKIVFHNIHETRPKTPTLWRNHARKHTCSTMFLD